MINLPKLKNKLSQNFPKLYFVFTQNCTTIRFTKILPVNEHFLYNQTNSSNRLFQKTPDQARDRTFTDKTRRETVASKRAATPKTCFPRKGSQKLMQPLYYPAELHRTLIQLCGRVFLRKRSISKDSKDNKRIDEWVDLLHIQDSMSVVKVKVWSDINFAIFEKC